MGAVLEDDGDAEDWDETNGNEKNRHGHGEEGSFSSN